MKPWLKIFLVVSAVTCLCLWGLEPHELFWGFSAVINPFQTFLGTYNWP